jgi:hypothetical protein
MFLLNASRLWLTLPLGVCLLASNAVAQDTAAAGALFDKGVTEMELGHFDVGCPALDESQRIEPRAGTLFASAECQARWGKVAGAVARYQDYIGLVSRLPPDQQSRHRDRVTTASDQLAKLKPAVPTLTIVLSANSPAGTIVRRNGVELKGAALGLPLPIDPGEHVLSAQAPGGQEKTVTVTAALNQQQRVELEAPASPVVAAPTAHGDASPASASERALESSQRTWAYAVGGVGIVGIVVGSTTGALVLGKKSTAKEHCSGGACRDQEGVDAGKSGKALATVSTIGFGVGVAGLAAGVILLLTAPRASQRDSGGLQPIVVVTPRAAFLGASHSF